MLARKSPSEMALRSPELLSEIFPASALLERQSETAWQMSSLSGDLGRSAIGFLETLRQPDPRPDGPESLKPRASIQVMSKKS